MRRFAGMMTANRPHWPRSNTIKTPAIQEDRKLITGLAGLLTKNNRLLGRRCKRGIRLTATLYNLIEFYVSK